MKMSHVKSSNIKAVGYDAKTKTLDHGVDSSHHAEMMKPATSIGDYLHKHIKPNHKTTKQ